MTPEQLAKSGTEHAIQCALFCWASKHPDPETKRLLRWMHAIPNGGSRNRASASKMVAEGVKSGVHDIFLPVARGPYHGLYIEMKKPNPRKVHDPKKDMSSTQVEFGEFVDEQGYAWMCMDDWQAAAEGIELYLDPASHT